MSQSLETLNHALYESYPTVLQDLFSKVKDKNAFHYALSFHPELKGYLDPSWSTLIEGFHLFEEVLIYLGSETHEEHGQRVRHALSFYVHLGSAPFFYQIFENFMTILEGGYFQLNPFKNEATKHFDVLNHLSKKAQSLQLMQLSAIFKQLVSHDLIEAYQFGDYYLSPEGIRLHCSSIQGRQVMTYDVFQSYLERLINFFVVTKRLIDEAITAFVNPLCVEGALQQETKPYRWQINYNGENKAFQILQLNPL
jgi:hypothetical protein